MTNYAERPTISQVTKGILALKDAICTQIKKKKKKEKKKKKKKGITKASPLISSHPAQQALF